MTLIFNYYKNIIIQKSNENGYNFIDHKRAK
jgi:hypothetical protein